VRSATLYEMRSLTGSQCNWRSRGLALARYFAWRTTRARMFWAHWSLSTVEAGAPDSNELQ